MNENQVSGVSRVELEAASRMAPASFGSGEPVQPPAPVQSDRKPAEAAPVAPKSEPVVNNSLKFLVDNETHEVTVLIVDSVTQKVVQSIPPEAMKDIPVGQLLRYSA